MRKLEILSHDDIYRIHLLTLEVLENIGVQGVSRKRKVPRTFFKELERR